MHYSVKMSLRTLDMHAADNFRDIWKKIWHYPVKKRKFPEFYPKCLEGLLYSVSLQYTKGDLWHVQDITRDICTEAVVTDKAFNDAVLGKLTCSMFIIWLYDNRCKRSKFTRNLSEKKSQFFLTSNRSIFVWHSLMF